MTSVNAELFHREHDAHDAFINARFSRKHHFEASADEGFCRHCHRQDIDHYDERCPLVFTGEE